MGQHQISAEQSQSELRNFVRALLDDVRALERMLDEGLIESGVRRIGAEQEMFLVDRGCSRPARRALLDLAAWNAQAHDRAGPFNLEINLSPQVLGGDCLSAWSAS